MKQAPSAPQHIILRNVASWHMEMSEKVSGRNHRIHAERHEAIAFHLFKRARELEAKAIPASRAEAA